MIAAYWASMIWLWMTDFRERHGFTVVARYRCIWAHDIGCSAVIWFNFHHAYPVGDWCEIIPVPVVVDDDDELFLWYGRPTKGV